MSESFIQFDSLLLDCLRGEVCSSSFDPLQLSDRAREDLQESWVKTLGELINVARAGSLLPVRVTERTAEEVETALWLLARSTQPNGLADWQKYEALRKSPEKGDSDRDELRVANSIVFLSGKSLRRLRNDVRAQPLGSLHLNARAIHCLERENIGSIGELIDRAGRRLIDVGGAGEKSAGEITDSLRALSRSVRGNGRVDWVAYAMKRGFHLLPAAKGKWDLPRRFISILPEVIGRSAASCFGARAPVVFRQLVIGQPGHREAVRGPDPKPEYSRQTRALIRDEFLRMLREAIFHDDYAGCHFRFREEFVAPLRLLKEALSGAGRRALTYGDWEKVLWDVWRMQPEELGELEDLLLSLMGRQILRLGRGRNAAIVIPRQRSTSRFKVALQTTDRLLRTQHPGGRSETQLLEELHAAGVANLDREELRAVTETMTDVERDARTGRLRVRIEGLRRMSDQLERILLERKMPMGGHALAEELSGLKRNIASKRGARHVRAAMSNDKRFKPIGRTGVWALAVWDHVETRTVGDIVADALRRSPKPMAEAKICSLVLASREVKKDSIGRMLREDSRFRRIAPLTWQLNRQSSRRD